MQVETVKIKTDVSDDNKLGYIVINKDEFDPKKHTEFVEVEEESDEVAPQDMTVAQLKDALAKIGVDIPADAKKADLLELLTNPKTAE